MSCFLEHIISVNKNIGHLLSEVIYFKVEFWCSCGKKQIHNLWKFEMSKDSSWDRVWCKTDLQTMDSGSGFTFQVRKLKKSLQHLLHTIKLRTPPFLMSVKSQNSLKNKHVFHQRVSRRNKHFKILPLYHELGNWILSRGVTFEDVGWPCDCYYRDFLYFR